MEITIKPFGELELMELYQILQLRSEVFVVEQDCVYQDIDGKDQKAVHILGKKDGKIVAYTRIFKPGHYFSNSSIGRVVVSEAFRSHKLGKEIMMASIKAIESLYGTNTVELSAQQYLVKFYNGLGFVQVGEGYLEDGIPHIRMVKN